jgi:hypothetical protein
MSRPPGRNSRPSKARNRSDWNTCSIISKQTAKSAISPRRAPSFSGKDSKTLPPLLRQVSAIDELRLKTETSPKQPLRDASSGNAPKPGPISTSDGRSRPTRRQRSIR